MTMPGEIMKSVPSTSSTSDESSVSASVKFCYEKEILLSLRKVPASLTRPDCLSKEFDSSDGFWDPDKWHKAQSGSATPQQRPSTGSDVPKGVPPRFKGDEDSNIVLGPQRRSFGLGCHVALVAKEPADRGKQNGFSAADSKDQRFQLSDSAGREQGLRLEKRNDLRKAIGSGRLQQLPNYDHRGGDGTKVTTGHRADLEPTWRRDDSSPLFNRAAGDNAKHSGNSKAPGLKSTKDEPEWFTADISQTDVIELRGFDAPERANTNVSRAPNKKLRLSTDLSKAAKEKPSFDRNSAEVKPVEASLETDLSSKKEAVPQPQGATAFDLNKFFEDFTVSIGSFQDETSSREGEEASLLVSSREGSRFSRWFGCVVTEAAEQPEQPAAMYSSVQPPPASPPIASSVSNLFKQWDSQEKSSRAAELSMPSLHEPAAASSNVTLDLTSNIKSLLFHNSQERGREHPRSPEHSELPAELIKLYGHMEARPLPSDRVRTVDEIESAIIKDKCPANKASRQITEQNEMPAFQKLVDMLQTAGELNRSIPRMPEEVAATHHLDLPTAGIQPSIEPVRVFEGNNSSPCIPSSSPVPDSHRRSLVDAWLRNSDYQEPSLVQALEHSPADSPLMFSTQPPGHVAVPAPIHPMQHPPAIQACQKSGSSYEMLLTSSLPQSAVAQSGSAFVKPPRSSIAMEHSLNHNLDIHFSTSLKRRDDERAILNSLILAESNTRPSGSGAPHVPAGFTPTSVMRKQASSKVDKRERLKQDTTHDAGTQSSAGSPQHPSPAMSYGSDQWHSVMHSQQQSAVYPHSGTDDGELAAPMPGIASLMPQAALATSQNVLPLDLQYELGQHVAVSLPTPTPGLGSHHQQTGYTSFHLPLVQQSGPMLHHQLAFGGAPPRPALFGGNVQLPVRRAILKSGTEMMPNGLSPIPAQHFQQQPQPLLLDQSRLIHANPESNVLHALQHQQLLQLRLQHHPRAAMSGVVPGPLAHTLLTPMMSQGVPRQLPIQPSAEMAPLAPVSGLGYRSPVLSRQHPMTMPQFQAMPMHLNARADPPGIPSEQDPLRKWFGNGFLQQMSAVPAPQKLVCALTVDDLEAM